MHLNDAILAAKNAAHGHGHTLRVVFRSEVAQSRPPRKDDYVVSAEGQLVRIKDVLCSVAYNTYWGDEVWPAAREAHVPWPRVSYFLLLEPM